MSAADSPHPRGSWSFIVNALAELGAKEIERRERQAQQADEPPANLADEPARRDDAQAQPDQHDAEPSEAHG